MATPSLSFVLEKELSNEKRKVCVYYMTEIFFLQGLGFFCFVKKKPALGPTKKVVLEKRAN